ncbi:hypothetical protein DE146DRAFT_610819 [Phaeosphaeria sp. MPI-PUGE-AT-0046c]|nr:hypothetical protein DE146DRAFT_610819 [Phaeosphaeria sp. MPI-PUGE-AT-0046c]
MTCTALRNALEAPDNDVSTSQMRKLITAGDYSGESLASISEDFLRAFCDSNLSHTRRRWIGVALARMLDMSPEVAQRFNAMDQQLQGLGEIILSSTEREETKIVAGIVVQQALQQHIEFAKFWASDKVRNSAPNFPVASTAAWLQNFQSFLDTLSDLALSNPLTDPVILYPVSVLAPNSFQWVNSNERGSIAIVQQDRLTLLLIDTMLRDIQFLDVPVSHISSVKARASGSLPDSQSRGTTHEPWDLIVTLKNESWTYLLNTSKRKAKALTLMFGRSEDAIECENTLRELQSNEVSVHKADASSDTNSPTASTHSASEPIKHNGKLPKVSHVKRRTSSQRVREEPDIFAIPSENPKKSVARQKRTTQQSPDVASETRVDAIRSSLRSAAQEEKTLKSKLRTKRRAEQNDDDFVPTAKSTKRIAKRRKDVAEPGPEGATSDMDLQRVNSQDQTDSRIPTVASRASLIGGLLSSQHRAAGDKTAFKKPALPSRATQQPSTPTQRPTMPLKASKAPRTGGSQSTSCAYDAVMLSPPPNGYGFGDEEDDLQTDVREAEILSSNSKPVPASPHADSTAITGHADRADIDLEKKRSEVQTAQSDPFQHQHGGPRTTPFVRRLTGDESEPSKPGLSKRISSPNMLIVKDAMSPKSKNLAIKTGSQPLRQALSLEGRKVASGKENVVLFVSQPAEHETGSDHEPTEAEYAHENSIADVDTTLINDGSEQPLPIYEGRGPIFRSSPPGTPSDHSSTSAEPKSSPPRSPLTSEAEEMEWEATLQPHQRALHDQLICVSKRVIRHVFNNETVVTDIADVYASDGEHLLKTMFERQDGEYKEMWDDMDAKKNVLKEELEKSARALIKERQRVRALS